jgi:hypothetical protein
VTDAIDKVENLFPSSDFMEKIAFHESWNGKHPDTGRSLYYGGVFQVDEGTFRET